jgi:hypothetical protein
MWADLLPRFIGGTLIDDDAPTVRTKIVSFTLTDEYVEIIGEGFSVGGNRRYFGVSATSEPGVLAWHGYSFSGLIIPPGPVELGEGRYHDDVETR